MQKGFLLLILLITFGILPVFLNNVYGEEKSQPTTGLRIAKGQQMGSSTNGVRSWDISINKWGQVLGYKFLFSNALTVLLTVV